MTTTTGGGGGDSLDQTWASEYSWSHTPPPPGGGSGSGGGSGGGGEPTGGSSSGGEAGAVADVPGYLGGQIDSGVPGTSVSPGQALASLYDYLVGLYGPNVETWPEELRERLFGHEHEDGYVAGAGSQGWNQYAWVMDLYNSLYSNRPGTEGTPVGVRPIEEIGSGSGEAGVEPYQPFGHGAGSPGLVARAPTDEGSGSGGGTGSGLPGQMLVSEKEALTILEMIYRVEVGLDYLGALHSEEYHGWFPDSDKLDRLSTDIAKLRLLKLQLKDLFDSAGLAGNVTIRSAWVDGEGEHVFHPTSYEEAVEQVRYAYNRYTVGLEPSIGPGDIAGIGYAGIRLTVAGIRAGLFRAGARSSATLSDDAAGIVDDLTRTADDAATSVRPRGELPILDPAFTPKPTTQGRVGESLSGLTGKKVKISINGRTRIPDQLADDVLTEVKNVANLSYTRQLRDFADYARQNGLVYELYVRSSTSLSGPLIDAIRNGTIILKYIQGI